MELCEGSTLKDLIDGLTISDLTEEENKRFNSKDNKIELFRQIAKGILHIHKEGFVHRDIKPSNIFLTNNYKNIKIGDFGLARNISQQKNENFIEDFKMSKNLGTPLYQSPDLENEQYDYSVDIFSLGVILLELIVPFSTQQERVQSLIALQKNKTLPSCIKDTKIGQLIQKMVDDDPKKRPTAKEVLKEIKAINIKE